MDWLLLSEKEVIEKLGPSETGLTNLQASERLKKYGENKITKTHKFSVLKTFLDQFKSFLIILLILAALLSFFMKSKLDSITILIIVMINAGLGFMQEYKAEKALNDLKKLLVHKSKVLRNNKVMVINSELVVPGDILIIEEGNKIVADARIIESNGLKINESSLTGESIPVEKSSEKLINHVPLADRVNMVYQGTEVVSGNSKVIVVNTGMNTEIGKISELVQKVEPEKNPFRERLDNFAKKIGILVIFISIVIVFLLNVTGVEIFNSFLVSVSLAVSAIPEGLPAVISLSLAFATKRMIKNNVLIRKLQSSETLGRVTVICTDKTGTLTEGKMEVTTIYANGKINPLKGKEALLKIGILCNKAQVEEKDGKDNFLGDPTEIALLISAQNNFMDKREITKQEPKIKEFPFNSERKMMSIIRKSEGKIISYVKGAPEKIIERCRYELIDGRKIEIDDKDKKRLYNVYEEIAKQGLRVLSFAYKEFPLYMKKEEITEENAENDLIFVGFQGMIDPPRKEVKESVALCRKAGIKVIMITGDSKLTAEAVAKEIGLQGRSIDSRELEKISDRALLMIMKDIVIFSRISPQDKLRIINLLKQKNEIVAMTGDGVNDALALKRADIGIAMGIRGTDVAKDSSDIIITDDNFSSIILGVKEGRTIYDNTKKFIKYLLAANFSEVTIVLLVILIWRNPELLPLLPLQILWINLVTDSFPALALSAESSEKNIMKRGPSKHEILNGIKIFIIVGGILSAMIGLFFFVKNIEDIEKARTMVVTSSIVFQMLLVFNSKSEKSVFKSPVNKYLFYAVAFSLFLHVLALYSPLNLVFQFVPLNLKEWSTIILLGFLGFIIMELVKMKT